MKINTVVNSIILSAVVALPVMANEVSEKEAEKTVSTAGTGPNPFSDCGIGAALFENDTAATISNVIWDVGTTALTSATASPETCNGKDVVVAEFIFESFDNIVEESAKGHGDHLAALMNILEVSQESQALIITTIRTDLATSISASDYAEQTASQRAETLYNSVMNAVNSAA